ncbi:MAG: sugar phosphate isomerase/epimerase [Victivallaceae bacterium]|nr:sugar phosphate isomerase/epimerase [Victivallaceae bacterium]
MNIGVIPQRLGGGLFESLRRAAKLGIDCVQPYSISRTENLLDFSDDQLCELKNVCMDSGLSITGICGEVGGFGFRLADKNPERIDLCRKNFELCRKLGGSVVSSHIGAIRPEPNDPLRLNQLDAVKAIGRYAKEFGIGFAIETGPERSETLRGFLDEVDNPYVGVNFDPANLCMIQNENACHALKVLHDKIFHVHIKDGKNFQPCDAEQVYAAFAQGGIKQLFKESGELFTETPVGEGDVNWPQCLGGLHGYGYDGALTIEREITPAAFEDTKKTVELLRLELSRL